MPILYPNAGVYVLAGPTGSGKSDLITYFQQNHIQALDLEGIACHDGSVFSPLRYGKQPTSYQFHKLLLKCWHRFDPQKPIFLESEMRRIGNLNLPEWLLKITAESDIIYLETNRNLRRARLSEVLAKAAPDHFIACLQKLSFKFGPEQIGLAMMNFTAGNFEETADVLMAYYDSTPGYSFSPERIKFKVEVTVWDPEEITSRILAALK